jgi:cytochrome P450
MALLQPVVAQRMAERNNEFQKRRIDGIQWTLDLTSDEDMDPYQVSLEILHNLFAGSLAPGAMITEMIFQALMDPKLLKDLRTEAQQALEECGWTDKLFQKLPLQDSFIRELNRVYPIGASK